MSRAPCPEVLALRPHRGGCTLTLRCSACAHVFEVEQDGIGGVAFGHHACPGCAAEHAVWPDDFAVAVVRAFGRDLGETSREAEVATALTESWHRAPVFRALLQHRGIDLGPPTERELLGCISEGLRTARTARERRS